MDRSRASRDPETADRWADRAAGNTAAGSPSSACGRAAVRCCTDPRCPAEVAWLCRCWYRRDDPVKREKEKTFTLIDFLDYLFHIWKSQARLSNLNNF